MPQDATRAKLGELSAGTALRLDCAAPRIVEAAALGFDDSIDGTVGAQRDYASGLVPLITTGSWLGGVGNIDTGSTNHIPPSRREPMWHCMFR
jgi:hypothetical protein